MLAIATPFPAVGSQAFVKPDATPCRILRRNADGTALIGIEERFRKASSNRTVHLADLAETAEQAGPAKRARRRKTR